MLPGAMDGFEVTRRSRASNETLPIWVISAIDDLESRTRAQQAGATAFYGKPFRPMELLDELNRIARG